MGHYSDLLFARPSILEGLGRLFDFSGALNKYNAFETGEEADLSALQSDWYAVGEDMVIAMKRLGERIESAGR